MKIEDFIHEWNIQADEANSWDNLDNHEAAEFVLDTIKEILYDFKPLIEEYAKGRPVVKLCYGLNNHHLNALRKILDD